MLKNSRGQVSSLPVYMDHHATTPVDPRVLRAMLPYFTRAFGNAASTDHEFGAQAARAVELARQQVAQLIHAEPREMVFTSGATESDNLAILGVAQHYIERGKHIITCAAEHKAVLDSCRHLQSMGWEVTYLPVDSEGLLDPDEVRRAIKPSTVLVSVMMANNEIGALEPIAEVGKIAHEHGVFFHSDCAQAVGHVPCLVDTLQVDLLSISAHKVYGPKGVGALYVRASRPGVHLAEQMHGGGHERGMRSGTLNVPGIVGLGKALELAGRELEAEGKRLALLRDRLWEGLQREIPHVTLNGCRTQRLPHNLNVAIAGVDAHSLLVQLKRDVALSVGSACSSASVEPSHVLIAMGLARERAMHSVRFGLGHDNTEADVDFVIERVAEAAARLRALNAS